MIATRLLYVFPSLCTLSLSLSLSLISERCSGSPVISPVVLEKTTKDRKSGRIPPCQEQRQPRRKPQIPYHETSCCQTVEPMHKNTNSANKARCVIGLVGFRPDRSWQSLHFTRKERTQRHKEKKGLFIAEKCSRGTSSHYGCQPPVDSDPENCGGSPFWNPPDCRIFLFPPSNGRTFRSKSDGCDLPARIRDNLL